MLLTKLIYFSNDGNGNIIDEHCKATAHDLYHRYYSGSTIKSIIMCSHFGKKYKEFD